MQTFLGTRTAADINMVAQVLLLAGLLFGFVLARRKQFRRHGNVQTAMVLLNLFLIAFAMAPSLFNYVVEGGTTTGTVATLMIVHGVLGTVVEVVAIYLILRMRTKLIPERFRVKNIKLVMRATLVAWTALVLLGLGVYGERYLIQQPDEASAPLLQMRQLSADLYVHAVELDDAATRFSIAAVKRHAEHIINITEGSAGPDYGDLDGNGHLEDPGDGIGLRNRLDAVLAVTPDQAAEADTAHARLDRIVALALVVVGATDITAATAPVAEILDLSKRTNADGMLRIDLAARAAGVDEEPMSLDIAAGSAAPDTTTVHEIKIKYSPETITIPVGTTVDWVNDERPKHTVTADDGTFDSTTMAEGDTFSHTFTQPGTWLYYCRFHGDVGAVGMSGTIIVK
jgi:plastocyanin